MPRAGPRVAARGRREVDRVEGGRPARGRRRRSSPTTTRRRWSWPGGRAAEEALGAEAPTFRFLLLAGERALGLDVPVAVRLLEQRARAGASGPSRATGGPRTLWRQASTTTGDTATPSRPTRRRSTLFRAAGNDPGGPADRQARGDLRIHGRSAVSDLEQRGGHVVRAARASPQLAEASPRIAASDVVSSRSSSGSARRPPSCPRRRRDVPVSREPSASIRATVAGCAASCAIDGRSRRPDEVRAGDHDDRQRQAKAMRPWRFRITISPRMLSSLGARPRTSGALEDATPVRQTRGLRARLAWLDDGHPAESSSTPGITIGDPRHSPTRRRCSRHGSDKRSNSTYAW